MNNAKPLPFKDLNLINSPFIHSGMANWRWKSTSRNYFNLWICMNGQATIRCDSQDFPVLPWTAFIFSPEVSIDGHGSKTGHMLSNFAAHWMPESFTQPENFSAPLGIVLQDISTAQFFIQSMMRLAIRPDALSAQQQKWHLLSLLALVWRQAQTPPTSRTERIVYQQIERMRSGQEMFSTVDELAHEAHLSRVHYSRCFKRITGVSPNLFLIQQRIDKACMLLKGSDSPLDQIAETIGYNDTFFFCRQFKKHMKESPHQYRLRNR